MTTSLPGSAFNRYVPGEKSPNADATLARIDSNLEDASAPAEISRQAASNANETMKASNLVGGAFLPTVSTQETGIAETSQTPVQVPTSQNAKSDTGVQQEGLLSRILSGIKRFISPSRASSHSTNATTTNTTNAPVISSVETNATNANTTNATNANTTNATNANTTNAQHIENNPIELLSNTLSSIKQQMTTDTVSAPRNTVGEATAASSPGTGAVVPVASSSPTAKTPENMQSAGLLSRILSGIKNRFAPPVSLPSSAPTDSTTGASKQENAGPSPVTVSTGFVNLMGWILNGVRAKFKAPVGVPPSVSSMTKDNSTATTTNKVTETTSRASEKETISSQTLRSVLSVLEQKKETGPANDAAVKVFDEGLANLQNVATDILREVKDGATSLQGGDTQGASAATTEAESKTAPYIPNQNDAANFAMSQAKGINATVPTKQQPTELYKPPVMLPDSDVGLVSGPTTLHDPNQTTLHAPADDNRTTLHTGPTPDQNRTTLHVPQEPVMMELDPLANKMADAISGLKDVVGGSVPVGGKSFDSADKGTSNSDLLNPFGLGDFLRTLKDKVGPTPIGQGASQVKDAMSDVPFSPGGETSNAGDIMGGLGKLASAIPIIGKPIEAMGKLGEVTLNSVGKLKDWTENLHSANMQFAEFSASMAEVQAEQMVRDIDLSRERGERRADSAKYLAESKSDLASTTAPIADLFANAKNYIGGALSQVTSTLLKPLSLIAKLLQKDSDKGDKSEINMGEWLAEMGKKGYFETYGTLDRSPFDLGDPRNR